MTLFEYVSQVYYARLYNLAVHRYQYAPHGLKKTREKELRRITALKLKFELNCGDKWLSINSAPKDGTAVLMRLYTKYNGYYFGNIPMRWSDYSKDWVPNSPISRFQNINGDTEDFVPTHWMPYDQ